MSTPKPREWHVSVKGSNQADGLRNPLRTILEAARRAHPSDTITVHEGVYREWIDPPWGGSGEHARITFQAAPGERVEIKGSEPVTGWQPTGDGTYSVNLPDSFFGSFNPFREVIEGDWFEAKGRRHLRGDVYINGESLHEVTSLEEVHHPGNWTDGDVGSYGGKVFWVESGETSVRIHAHFQGMDPVEALVEVTVRPTVFTPSRSGIGFITVRGFDLSQAATTWAPPTAEQVGLIGPYWSAGWIIEDNQVHDSRCSGICLGKERASGHNRWGLERVKHGSQRERETVLAAVHHGWKKGLVGGHVVRRNEIHHCEQAGVVGHLGCAFSTVEGNHIHHIHVKRRFEGAEIAGLKFHAPIDTRIEGNHIHHCSRGLWLDWQAQGTRVSRNLLHDNLSEDLFVEVCHGPYLVDHNVFLSPMTLRDASQGGAFVHNLFAGRVHQETVPIRFTPYHFPHSTEVAGFMTILGGDDRFLNNIFLEAPWKRTPQTEQGGTSLGDITLCAGSAQAPLYGLAAYDAYPHHDEPWLIGTRQADFIKHRLPMRAEGNLHLHGAKPWRRESDAIVDPAFLPQLELLEDHRGWHLAMKLPAGLDSRVHSTIHTQCLGIAFQAEMPYENPDGSPLTVDRDYFGADRASHSGLPGPFSHWRDHALLWTKAGLGGIPIEGNP